MISFFKKHFVLPLSILILWLLFALMLVVSLHDNQNHLVYSLDDAYIHMAMAKNYALYGIWGITKYEFTPCSSSIIWTLLLSLVYFIFKPNVLTPLMLNILFATIGHNNLLFYFFKRKIQ